MEITENNLINKIARFSRPTGAVVRGIGDDGAVVNLDGGPYIFVQDAMVEGVHFDFALQKPYDVGKKAVYANVADVLAMGGKPMFFLTTIGVPKSITSSHIDSIYRGMSKAAGEFGATLLGGDTTATTGAFFLDISMFGKSVVPVYLGRDKARAGHLIAVTGQLGESAYGLKLLKGEGRTVSNRFTKRYATPKPPLGVWQTLVDSSIPKAMMDISDGLLIDLQRMMKESRKGAIVHLEHVPMPTVLRKDGLESLAISGGEDYQFLFTFERSRLAEVESLQKNHPDLSVIGEVVTGQGVMLLDRGEERSVAAFGYEHFRGDNEENATTPNP